MPTQLMTALRPGFPSLTRRQRVIGLLLFFAYIGATILGIQSFVAPAILTPTSGIALAGLVIGGIELWPMVFLAAVAAYMFYGSTWVTILFMSVGVTLQAVIGAYALKKLSFNPSFERLRDMLSFMVVAFVSSTIVPSLGFLSRALNHLILNRPSITSSVTWGSWWTGVLFSMLIITPLILTWVFQKKGVHTRMQRAEAVLAFAILIFLDYVLFWTSSTQVAHISLVYFILVPLMWISLRFGARYTTLSLFITALIAFGGLLWGRMTPPSDMLGLRLFQDETFIDIIAVLFFILVAIEEERKTALRNLKSHIVKLEEAVGMRDDFISIASHELKTPVTTLKIYSQTMERELSQKGQETLAGQVSKMDAQLDKLISLVEDLLNVSRSRLGKLEFRKEIFDLEHCIRETVADIRSTTPQRTIEIDGELSHPVYGDRDRIAQVAVNLVNNALKYSPKTSPVFVRLSDEDGFVKVSVRDFGIGIDEEHHQKIFELFYRVPDAGEKTYPGFGIGLHLSNNIVKRHGGKLHVKSRKGEGSEFSFTLPFAHVRRDERSRAKLQKNKLTS